MKYWKQVERKIAELLGGVRILISGRQKGATQAVEHSELSIELKRAVRHFQRDSWTPWSRHTKAIRRYHARQRDANRWAWIHYYEGLARCHARLAQEHADRAEALLGERQTGGEEDLGA